MMKNKGAWKCQNMVYAGTTIKQRSRVELNAAAGCKTLLQLKGLYVTILLKGLYLRCKSRFEFERHKMEHHESRVTATAAEAEGVALPAQHSC